MKYLALTLSTLALALLTLVAVLMSQTMGTPKRMNLPPQVSLRPLDARELQDQQAMKLAISELMPLAQVRRAGAFAPVPNGAVISTASGAPSNPLSGQIFALTPQASPAIAPKLRRAGSTRAAAAPLPLPRVSVVVEGSSGVKAMVNGNLVSVGDHIEGGLLVKSIDIDAVTFASGKEELEIKMPLERLRVLGAFPPPPRSE